MKLHAILLAIALSACYVSAPPPDPGYPSPPVDTQPQPIEPAMPAPSPDYGNVPRVMFWPGKVAQHWDTNTQRWETDPDGVTGAARDDAERLAHCRKWYPATRFVRPYAMETISTWRERGNVNAHTATMQSYECVAR
jgi:Amyloid A4 N-terminal heparin-binding